MFPLLTRFQLSAFLLILLFGLPVLAQTGKIAGQVTDQEGAAVSGAAVQVVSQDSTIKRETKTDSAGSFAVRFLPAGTYQVMIQAQGFGSALSDPISLAANQESVFNAQLSIATAKSEVTIAGGAASTAIELESASLSTTLSEKEVSETALNGRNFTQLIALAPGVSNQTGQDEAKVGVAGSAKFSVNGGRVEYNTFEVDGSDVVNTSINASRGQGEPLVVYPSIDAIQEMKVLTSNYSAMYGKSASGSVLVTTKSGTANLHGNAYGFVRNEMFNARNYFDQPGRTPLYRRLDFGATVGGPIFIKNVFNTNKDKTFFFFSEEMRLEKTPVSYNQAVPTMAERGGDFSDVCPTILPGGSNYFNPVAYPDCPYNRGDTSNGNGYVPRRTVNVGSIGKAILDTGLIPQPNSVLGCNTTNPNPLGSCYVASVSPDTHWREELFRIDHSITTMEQLSLRFIHDSWNTTTLTPQWGIVQNSFPTVQNRLDGPGLDVMATLTQTLHNGILNRISFGYTVEHITLTPQTGQGLATLARPAALSSMGSIFQNNGFGNNKMPGLMFQGSNGAYGGHGFAVDTGYAPWSQSNPRFELRDDASKIIGKHTLQFGFDGNLVQQNELSAVSGANSGDLQGLLTFSNQQSIYTSGNAFVDFLAGPGTNTSAYSQTGIKSYTQDSGQLKYYNRYKMAELYLQDDWHINTHLTLNFGFRSSLFGTWYNAKGTAYNWTPAAYNNAVGSSVYIDSYYGYLVRKTPNGSANAGTAVPLNLSSLDAAITNGLTQCGKNGVPSSCMKSHIFNPAPRIGFAWDPSGSGKTSIRAGYGLFWEHGTGYEANAGSLTGGAPLILSETQSNVPGSTTAISSLSNIGACLGGATQCGSGATPTVPTFPLNVTSIPSKAVYSYTQQWSLGVQHELRKDSVVQLAYVGAKGTHLSAVRDLNQLQPLSSALNPFTAGQPITRSVCGSAPLYGGYFSTSGTNPNPLTGPPITSSPGLGPTSPGYTNMVLACTGNPGFVGRTGKLLGVSADAVRPYPGFSNIISVDNIADSEYHALQGTLRETTGPLTMGISYTYSHSLDDSSDRASANFANSLDIKANHASSDFDQRHMVNISYLYQLPLLRLVRGFANLVDEGADLDAESATPASNELSPFWTTVLGGWQLTGITTFQSGTPFSVINGGGSSGIAPADNAGMGNGLGIGSYVDVIGGAHGVKPTVSGGSGIGPLLLNPGAFAAPRGLTFGNSGRNFLNNPSRSNFNMSLLKHFKPRREGMDVEFRAEAYNIFNHTQFRIYDPTHPGNTGNNVVNCYGDIATGYSAAGGNGTDCLTGNSFLHPVDAHDPRILQFGLKVVY